MNQGSRSPRGRVGILASAVLATALTTYSVMWGDGHTIFAFAGKEQFFELLSAWLFFLTCLFCLGAWDRCRRRGGGFWRSAQYLVLALFFFVAFGEELSWGQHYLGYSTPEALRGLNQQGELNLHNLTILDSQTEGGRRSGLGALLNSNRLFDYFMIGFFLLGPVGYRLVPFLRGLADRFSVPIVAAILGAPLVLNWLLTVGVEVWLVDNDFRHLAVSEIRELNYSVLCAAGLGWLFWLEGKLGSTREPGS